MTAIRMTYLQCDTPNCCSSTSDECHDRALDARHFAKERGWTHRSGRDICPHCRAGRGPYHYYDELLDDDELLVKLAERRERADD